MRYVRYCAELNWSRKPTNTWRARGIAVADSEAVQDRL